MRQALRERQSRRGERAGGGGGVLGGGGVVPVPMPRAEAQQRHFAALVVRRCKLDPNLKAPGFKGST